MDTPTVEEIQLDIDDAKAIVAKRDALIRLENNADFKALILDGYFKDEAVRLVEAKGSPSLQLPEHQEAIIKSIDGIGALKAFFRATDLMGSNAAAAIEDSERLLEELAEEGEV